MRHKQVVWFMNKKGCTFKMERQQGGWNPVFRRRQGRNGAAVQLHTIFVDDIPDSMNVKGLYTMFSNFGAVKDVYIPGKRRKATRTRFGFVRYDCPVATRIAIQKANGVWCGDKSLKVKNADFGKEKDLPNPRPRAYKPDGASRLSGAGIGGRYSYAEVVKGGNSGRGNNIRIKAEEYAIGWLLQSAVIKFKPQCNFDAFKTECRNRGLTDIQLREGGGRNAFITFNSIEVMKQSLNNSGGWLSEWCESIIEWNKGVILDNERLVSLNCFGMPPNLWNVNNFRKIGEAFGTVMEIDHNVSSMKSLRCGRIRICTSHLEHIDQVVMLERDGRYCPVRVVEAGELLTTSMDEGDHCSVTHHPNRSEDDDVGNIEADVERSHYMAHSKKSKVEVVGAGHKHTCTSDSVSMVKETGVELGTRNHDAACPAPNVRVQTPSEREVDKGERRESQVVETSIGPHGLIRSLSSGDLNRPAISLEVVLNQTCFSADGRMLPAATAWAKLDGDEVAGNRALIGADLACINEVEQRKESLDNHTAEEGGTIVEETPREGGSSREKVACVAGPSMDGSEQTSNSNDGTFRGAQQDSPSGHSSGYDFNNGFGPDFNFAENLNIESADNLGPSIGPGINLEVCLVHSPNVPEPPPKPIESYNLNPISSGLLALGQSVSPTPKSGPIGKIPRNLTHSAQSKLPILTKKSLHPEKKKGKKKINLEGFNSFARFHGYRTAAAQKPTSKSVIFKPAASVFAQSELSNGSSSSNKHLLEEAKATIQLGKSLGINFNGKEDIVLSKIIDLEIKDKDRISNDGKAQK